MIETVAPLPLADVLHVRDTCLCFAAQRAARKLARRFDAAFRPLGITNNQFSLMMRLSVPKPATVSELSAFLGIDQTTTTAALKALERTQLVTLTADDRDKRIRRPALTDKGKDMMRQALPIWRTEHARLDTELAGEGAAIRAALDLLAAPPPPSPNRKE